MTAIELQDYIRCNSPLIWAYAQKGGGLNAKALRDFSVTVTMRETEREAGNVRQFGGLVYAIVPIKVSLLSAYVLSSVCVPPLMVYGTLTLCCTPRNSFVLTLWLAYAHTYTRLWQPTSTGSVTICFVSICPLHYA